MYAFCLPCPSATFALQHAGFVPREWLATKGLLQPEPLPRFAVCSHRSGILTIQ